MRYDAPIFDPFEERGDDYYHPEGEAANHLMQISFTHRDIARLFGMLDRAADDYERKLLTKFIVVEFLSLDTHVCQLVGLALSKDPQYPLEMGRAEELKKAYGAYTAVRKHSLKSLEEIRNKIAAHRDPLDLLSVARLWDAIDAITVYEMIVPLVPLFECMKELGIYRWSKMKQTPDGVVVAYIAPINWGSVKIDSRGDEEKEQDAAGSEAADAGQSDGA